MNNPQSKLNQQIADLQSRLPVFQGWRPASASSADATQAFSLPLTPDVAVVTLFQWAWNRPDRPTYTLNPMPSTLVAENSTAVIEVPKQSLPQTTPSKHPQYYVDTPCRVFVTFKGKTLSYTTEACPAEGSSPAFNIIFMFTSSSQATAREK